MEYQAFFNILFFVKKLIFTNGTYLMSNLLRKFLLFAVFITTLLLTACGGSGGSGSSNQSPGTNQPEILSSPIARAQSDGQQININWDESYANEYRVLYWQGNETPQEFTVTNLSYQTPALSPGHYTILIEAYDDLGNSLFSAPINVDVM